VSLEEVTFFIYDFFHRCLVVSKWTGIFYAFFSSATDYINMTLNKKFSAILAVLVIGFLSIYANNIVFNSSNATQQQLNITLNMQSGAQIPLVVPPGQAIPTNLNGDQVVAVSIFGTTIPAGANAIIATSGGNLQLMWQMAGSSAMGVAIGNGGSPIVGWPDTGEVS
jgi:hypothetical protein